MRDEAAEPIELRIIFTPLRNGAALRWEADVLGVRTSRFVAPIERNSLPLVLRALDVLQDPEYPNPWTPAQRRQFQFNSDEVTRLDQSISGMIAALYTETPRAISDAGSSTPSLPTGPGRLPCKPPAIMLQHWAARSVWYWHFRLTHLPWPSCPGS
jgi:hypothetical protein